MTDRCKMKPEPKAQWLEALRSGTFLQGTNYLRAIHEDDKKVYHCCLGVLADIQFVTVEDAETDEGHGGVTKNNRPVSVLATHYNFGEGPATGSPDDAWFAELLTDFVDADLNPTEDQGYDNTVANDVMSKLIKMNDDHVSFNGIADWIEEHL